MNIGDKVRIKRGKYKYANGTIICLDSYYEFGVEFDIYIGGHDCDGKGRYGHCWYFEPDEIELIEDININSINIKWYRDGKLEKKIHRL